MYVQRTLSGFPTTDDLIPDNITFIETNRDLHAAAAICSGSKPNRCNIEVLRPKKYASFPFSVEGHEITEIENSGCLCLGHTEVGNRCHNNAETSHPLKGTGCCLAVKEGPDCIMANYWASCAVLLPMTVPQLPTVHIWAVSSYYAMSKKMLHLSAEAETLWLKSNQTTV